MSVKDKVHAVDCKKKPYKLKLKEYREVFADLPDVE